MEIKGINYFPKFRLRAELTAPRIINTPQLIGLVGWHAHKGPAPTGQ
jgi:hypothetical protein